jgi:hypothetical protein
MLLREAYTSFYRIASSAPGGFIQFWTAKIHKITNFQTCALIFLKQEQTWLTHPDIGVDKKKFGILRVTSIIFIFV